jgi:hypothetical protein
VCEREREREKGEGERRMKRERKTYLSMRSITVVSLKASTISQLSDIPNIKKYLIPHLFMHELLRL